MFVFYLLVNHLIQHLFSLMVLFEYFVDFERQFVVEEEP
jgi:hypothetical protein